MMKRISTLCVVSSALAAFAFCANSAGAGTLTVRTTTVKVPTQTPTVHTPPTGAGGIKPGIVKQTLSSGSAKHSTSTDTTEQEKWGFTYRKIEFENKSGKTGATDSWYAH